MSESNIARIAHRPRPPADLTSMDGLMRDQFQPAPDLWAWIASAYLEDGGPLFNPDHAHLGPAFIGCLWTNAENRRQQRRIVGQAEMPERSIRGKGGRWQQARAEMQLRDWFGGDLPDFLITLDAVFAADCEHETFCALVDHELYHCAQAEDEFGMPRFNQQTGDPIWAMRGHDVEEFVGVVRRFGVEAAGPGMTDLMIAAAGKPEVARARIAQACGTCQRRAAA